VILVGGGLGQQGKQPISGLTILALGSLGGFEQGGQGIHPITMHAALGEHDSLVVVALLDRCKEQHLPIWK
jgi:hypothetical protein